MKIRSLSRPLTLRLAAISCSALALVYSPSFAASSTWNVNASASWATPGSWSGSVIPGTTSGTTSTDTATFGSIIASSRTVTVDANRNVQNIAFESPGAQYTLNGGSLLLTNGGTISYVGSGSLIAIINSPVTLLGNAGTYNVVGNSTGSRGIRLSGSVSGVSTVGNVTTLNLSGTGATNSLTVGNNILGVVTDGTNGGKLAITKAGSSTWSLSSGSGTSNTFTGGITINAGALRFVDTGTFAGNGNVTGNAFGTNIVTLNSGTLGLNADGAKDNSAQQITFGNDVVVGGNSTINVANFATGTSKTLVLGNISMGAQTLTTSGADSFALRVGTVTTSGASLLNATTAALTTGSITVANSVSSGSTVSITLTGNSATSGVSGVISDNSIDNTKKLNLLKAGTSTWTLSSSNSYTGGTGINGGVLNVVSGALGSSGTITFGGGTLQYATGNTQDISSRLIGSGSAIAIDSNGNDITFASAIGSTNTGGLTKTGLGMLTLSGSNTYTGPTTVNGGGISVSNSFWSGSGSALTLNSGTFRTTGAVTMNTSAPLPHTVTVSAGGGVFDVNGGLLNIGSGITGAGNVTKIGSGTMQMGGSSFTGTLNLNAGVLQVVASNRFSSAAAVVFDGGTLNLANNGGGAQSNSNAIVLNSGGGVIRALSGTEAWTLSGNISGTGSLTSSGTGTLVLSGSNTYSGSTSVTAGTLLVNGSLSASSAVRVTSGATLGGSGTIGGSLQVNSGGTLAPGNSPGILSVGDLTLAGSLAQQLDTNGGTPVAGTNYDQLNVTGFVNLTGGDLALSLLTGVTTGDVFYIILNDGGDGVTGFFTTLNGVATTLTQGSTFTSGGQLFQISYNADAGLGQFIGSGNDVALLAVPEPATYVFLGLGMTVILWRARRRHVRG